MKQSLYILWGLIFNGAGIFAQQRAADMGIHIGVLASGKLNTITDVPGVCVGQTTILKGDSVKTGVTVILPHQKNIFQNKVPAGVYIGNGFGKLTGSTQIKELGNIETPIVLTNTLSVSTAMKALVHYTIHQKGNENIQSVNAVVGETNDSYLNDIRGMHVTEADVLSAIANAVSDKVEEGNVGAGTGTVCFGFKGGIGTASRILPKKLGGYTIGVLVQTNFGGVLNINGAPVGKELKKYYLSDILNENADGSCMVVVATDAPLDARNLERLAKRAFMGIAKTGGIASNGSGDYVIAFSTDSTLFVPYNAPEVLKQTVLSNDAVSPLFMAAIEATEEAIINSFLAAKTTQTKNGKIVETLPKDKLKELLIKYHLFN